MGYHDCPPKIGRKINPLLKGLEPYQVSFLRHRRVNAWLEMDFAREAAAAERAEQGWLLFVHDAHDRYKRAVKEYRDACLRADFAESFAIDRRG